MASSQNGRAIVTRTWSARVALLVGCASGACSLRCVFGVRGFANAWPIRRPSLQIAGCKVAAALASRAGAGETPDELEAMRAQLREMGIALEKDFQGDAQGAEKQPLNGPRQYYREMRGTEVGNAFWRRKFEGAWGQFAEGEAGAFDLDDLVEAVYPGSDKRFSAQVKRYTGNGDWIVVWMDDLPEGSAQASVVKTKDMKHIRIQWD
uniref:Uncharacterized protein n=1 Tax=Pyrodinium bahamense TaxID=73915 RepID=A0A7S0FIP9_9DINO